MQFAYVKSLAEEVAKERVFDVILTVPPYFSNAERQALLDAVEIGGLRPLALLNDGTAIAVNYAMTRSFPAKEYHVILDAGAGSIRAPIASFYTPDAPPATTTKVQRSVKTTTKESAEIDILAFGWNHAASGNELTRRIKERLVEAFEKSHGLSLSNDGRALARIWKEAERVKSILSANADSSTTVGVPIRVPCFRS
jgi:hypoxia up-regulated 1